jgi:hypothetical protein
LRRASPTDTIGNRNEQGSFVDIYLRETEQRRRDSFLSNEMGMAAEASRYSGRKDKGHLRRGIRAGNFVAEACTGNLITSPRYEYPQTMVTSCEYDVDGLTAMDQAIYHYLMARMRLAVNELNAKDKAKEKTSHLFRHELVTDVSVADLVRYTGIKATARIRDSLTRISKARARYDLRQMFQRDVAVKPLIDFTAIPDKLTSKTTLEYRIDRAVRVAQATGRRYVMVDLNALTRFQGRYTARLYLLLSIHATKTKREIWRPSMDDLIDLLGYPRKAFHRGNFIAQVTKAVSEIDALPYPLRRFEFSSRPPEGHHGFRFLVGAQRRSMFDVRWTKLEESAFQHAEDRDIGMGLRETQFVRARHIAHAVTYTGVDGLTISEAWRSAVVFANANPIGKIGDLPCSELLANIDKYGAVAGFEAWVNVRYPDAYKIDVTPMVFEWSKDTGFEVVEDKADEIKSVGLAVEIADDEYDDEDDLKMGDDSGDLGYGEIDY